MGNKIAGYEKFSILYIHIYVYRKCIYVHIYVYTYIYMHRKKNWDTRILKRNFLGLWG